jgi:hypothetical protein
LLTRVLLDVTLDLSVRCAVAHAKVQDAKREQRFKKLVSHAAPSVIVAAGPACGKRRSASAAAARWLAKMPTYFATPGTVILIFSIVTPFLEKPHVDHF